jgi:enoyl-CoA hydratase
MPESVEPLVLEDAIGAVRYLTLNRPRVLNALNEALESALCSALVRADDDPTVRVVVLRGAGRAFSAGADLKERAESAAVDVDQVLRDFSRSAFLRVWAMSKPVIAAVHGYCLGGAHQLAAMCDLTIAAESARFGEPEIRFSNPLLVPITPLLTRPKKAREILYTGEYVDGRDAARIGLVSEVVADGDLDARVAQVAQSIASVPPAGVREARRAWNFASEAMGLLSGATTDAEMLGLTFAAQAKGSSHEGLLAATRVDGARLGVEAVAGGDGGVNDKMMSATTGDAPGGRGPTEAYEDLLVERRGQVAVITLSRPRVLNALSSRLQRELDDALGRALDDVGVRVVVLTGAGRAFSAGIDLKEPADPPSTEEGERPYLASLLRRCLRLWDADKPIIAAVNGYCLGHACDLAAIADLTIAAESARFGVPEVRHLGGVAAMIYPYLMDAKRGRAFLYLGEMIDAHEAEATGLVNRVVPDDALLATALELADKLCQIPAPALRQMKRAINRSYELMGLRETLLYNLESLSLILTVQSTKDLEARQNLIETRGLRAFLDARDQPFAPSENSRESPDGT